MKKKIIYVFGNPDLPNDSLTVKLIPKLSKKFPEIKFINTDPENLDLAQEDLVIIDTVSGINNVQVFKSLEMFEKKPKVSLHDFDLGMQLFLQQKLGKMRNLKIIGVPPNSKAGKAFGEVVKALETSLR